MQLLYQLYNIRTNVTGTFFSSNFATVQNLVKCLTRIQETTVNLVKYLTHSVTLGDCKQCMCTAALLLEPKL